MKTVKKVIAAIVALGIIIAFVALGLTVVGFMKASDCKQKRTNCSEPITRVMSLPDEPAPVSEAVLGSYGVLIQKLKDSKNPSSAGLAENLKSQYIHAVNLVTTRQVSAGCVRDGLVELLVTDDLDTARADVVTKSLEAAAQVNNISPDPAKAMDNYFTVGAKIIPSGTFLVGTYQHYLQFPIQMELACRV